MCGINYWRLTPVTRSLKLISIGRNGYCKNSSASVVKGRLFNRHLHKGGKGCSLFLGFHATDTPETLR
jgi:hypothetical protein